jgi:hypothetical protein
MNYPIEIKFKGYLTECQLFLQEYGAGLCICEGLVLLWMTVHEIMTYFVSHGKNGMMDEK